ncbi:MAG TPA: EAL domain-containing protein [Candidatus Acidoferrales bacterium]|nr:EAL domain-containing protein [Candidatus Acidoferrales bacterium]
MTDTFREIFERNPHPMWVYALDTLRILAVNQAAIVQYGYSREQFLAMTIEQLRPDADQVRLSAYVASLGSTPDIATSTWHHKRADGSEFICDVSSTALTFAGVAARIAVCVDATDRAAMETALRRSRASLAEAQQLAHLGSWEIDLVTRQITWSAELYRILGADYASDAVSTLYEFDHPEDRELVRAAIERAERERRPYKVDHRIITRDGRERYVQEQGEFFYDESGKPYRCVGAILDITERKLAEERLVYLAHHDSLTDLPNRSLLTDRLVQSLGRARRRGRSVAVLFIDVDRFKSVNDTLGHEGGDAVLRTVGQRLRDLLRPGDTIARPGGDEFIIVLDDLASTSDAQTIAERVLAAIAEPIRVAEAELFVTGSIGIALSPDDGNDPDELLRNADAAMYVSKTRGGDAIELFTPAIRQSTIEQLAIESALRLALDREQICVAYQPIVDARTGLVVALEALARWTDPEHGVVNPEQFIRVAEEAGLTLRLGEQVLMRACRRMRSLIDRGHHDLSVAVNISPRQFREPDFAADVRRILETCDLAPRHLQLEITENAYISGVDASIRNIVALKRMGVHMSIDDFGTGFSALGYLKRLPVHSLKIDRSFISDILHDAADQAIVRAIIAVAENLGLRVVAEGVENQRQAELLRELGCHQLQGFYFGRPVSEDAIQERLEEATAV